MNKKIRVLSLLSILFFMSSFSKLEKDDFIGTYGTQSVDPSQIILKINIDETFYFQDFSNPLNKITVSGNWKKKGNKIVLLTTSSFDKFHTKWNFKENAETAHSRLGLTFYSLHKIK